MGGPTRSQSSFVYLKPSLKVLWSLMLGQCQNMLKCPLFCQICQKYCLDPRNSESRAQHLQDCQKLHARLQAYIKSMEAECAICLEKVLTKPNLSDRRFGLMACDHIFCLPCIRNWRSADDGNVDVTSVGLCTTLFMSF